MAPSSEQVLQNIRRYAEDVRAAQGTAMDLDASQNGDFEKRLDATIKELQGRVRDHEKALETLRASSSQMPFNAPSSDKRERLQQLKTLKSMYEVLTPTEPALPHPTSLLPAVLALKTVHDAVIGTKQAVGNTRRELASKSLQLKQGKSELADDRQIFRSITDRIARLEVQNAADAQKTPEQFASELIESKRSRKVAFEDDTMRLHDALIDFVDENLGAMVAAEELGGPLVGDMLDVDDDFLAQRSVKPSKASGAALEESARQERIDDIWGGEETGDGPLPRTEREAAATEVKLLIERLIAALISTSSTDVYVSHRDSAAARFLVRAKVAQYHPKDARRLRLVDFGREFD